MFQLQFLDVYVPSEKERGDAEVFSRNMQLLVAQWVESTAHRKNNSV